MVITRTQKDRIITYMNDCLVNGKAVTCSFGNVWELTIDGKNKHLIVVRYVSSKNPKIAAAKVYKLPEPTKVYMAKLKVLADVERLHYKALAHGKGTLAGSNYE